MYHLNWRPIFQNFDLLWQGLLMGLGLALLSLAMGCVIGILAAFARVYGGRSVKALATAYTEFVRNIPLLLIIYFVFYGLGLLGLHLLNNIWSFVLALAVMAVAAVPRAVFMLLGGVITDTLRQEVFDIVSVIPETDAEEITTDLVIVGGGPAGLSAGIYAARSGLDSVILEKGVLGLFMPEFDLSNIEGYFQSPQWTGIIGKWEGLVRAVVEAKGQPPRLY